MRGEERRGGVEGSGRMEEERSRKESRPLHTLVLRSSACLGSYSYRPYPYTSAHSPSIQTPCTPQTPSTPLYPRPSPIQPSTVPARSGLGDAAAAARGEAAAARGGCCVLAGAFGLLLLLLGWCCRAVAAGLLLPGWRCRAAAARLAAAAGLRAGAAALRGLLGRALGTLRCVLADLGCSLTLETRPGLCTLGFSTGFLLTRKTSLASCPQFLGR